ncbi:50S ribosomal protein L18 [uncultured archaeon]|nr:50S ribosomal protein L18 [uncultured archaeon]
MARATGPTYNLSFKRRRLNLTNYRKRLALLKSGIPRFVVRKTNRAIIIQLIQFTPNFDKTLVSANSAELKSVGWHPKANLPTAYLTALLCAERAKGAKVEDAVLDIGLQSASKGAFIFAALKGALDGGLKVPVGEVAFDEARISGKHIAEYAKKIAGSDAYKRQFGDYIKAGAKPENLDAQFADAKKKISSGAIPAKAPKAKSEKKPAAKPSKAPAAKAAKK